jgi:hypothetical protein
MPPGGKFSELFYLRTLRDNSAQSQLGRIRPRLYKKGLGAPPLYVINVFRRGHCILLHLISRLVYEHLKESGLSLF